MTQSRKFIIIAAVIAVVVVAAWFLVLYKPQTGKLAAARDEIDKAGVEQTQLESELVEMKKLLEKAPEIDAALADAQSTIPDEADLQTFIRDTHTIAEESGVDWVSVSPGAPSDGGAGVSTISVSIEFTSSFFSAIDFVDKMTSEQRRAVTITSMNMASAPEGVTVQLNGAIYMATPAGSESPASDTGTTTKPESES